MNFECYDCKGIFTERDVIMADVGDYAPYPLCFDCFAKRKKERDAE